MKFYKSRYYIKPIILNWIIGILFIADVFLAEYIPKEIQQEAGATLIIVYVILFLFGCFYLFFMSFDEWELKKQIEKIEKDIEKSSKYADNSEKEELLIFYKEVRKQILGSNLFIHLIKTKVEVTNMSNIGNYLLVLFILYTGQFSFDYSKPIGPLIFLFIVLVCIIYCIRILFWDWISEKKIITNIIIGHILAIYILFNWGKNSYVRSYGNEILGSYFEKPEYKTKYYINLFSKDERVKKFRLPAEIDVYSEDEEAETNDGNTKIYTTKYIMLSKVFWPISDSVMKFEDCQIAIGDRVLCSEENGRQWYIELTNEKVR